MGLSIFRRENTFVEIIKDCVDSVMNSFSFMNFLNRKDYNLDINYLMFTLENFAKENKNDITRFIREEVLPNMPNRVWAIEDCQIYVEAITSYLKEKKLLENIEKDPLIRKPKTMKDRVNFFQLFFKMYYTKLMATSSEKYALLTSQMKEERILEHLEILREVRETFLMIKEVSDRKLKEIVKIKNDKGFEIINRNICKVLLFSLRICSISSSLEKNQIEPAVKEANYLGLERISWED